jgi:hypothetical protein
MGDDELGRDDVRVELRPSEDVVFRRVEDEVVLVNMRTNEIFALNATAARLWELLSQGNDRASAEARLLEEFEVSEGELKAEVDAFFGLLEREGLLSR